MNKRIGVKKLMFYDTLKLLPKTDEFTGFLRGNILGVF